MADRYLVATGNWSSTAVWSSSSGGAAGASVPTSSDDVYLNAASGAAVLTIDELVANWVANKCRTLDCTGFTGELAHGDGYTLEIYGGLKLVAGMTYTPGGTMAFYATSGSFNVDTGGKVPENLTFGSYSGSSATWTFTAAMGARSAEHVSGTLDFNGQTITDLQNGFTSQSEVTRTLTLGAATINVSLQSNSGFALTSTGLTFSGASSTINMTSFQADFFGGGHTFGTVNFAATDANKHVKVHGANTFTNLSFTMGAVKTCVVSFAANQTVTGTITITGNSAVNRMWLKACNDNNNPIYGTSRTLTAATVSMQNVDFTDITGAGAGTWSGTSIGNGLGNSGITFTAAVTRYWIGNAGTWSSTAEWSATSGGAGSAGVPLCHDTVVFDANSFSANGHTITVDMPRLCASIDFSATDQTFTFTTNAVSGGEVYWFGAVTLDSNITLSGDDNWHFLARSSVTFETVGKTMGTDAHIVIEAAGGTITLGAAALVLSSTGDLKIEFGTFNANNQNVTARTVSTAQTSSTRAITMGSGTWTLTNTAGSCWFFPVSQATNLTITANTSQVTMSGAGTTYFYGGSKTYYNVQWTGAGSKILEGSNTFNNLLFASTATTSIDEIAFDSAGTTTVAATLTLTGGSTTDRILIHNQEGGVTAHTINAAVVALTNVDFMDITGAGAATWSGTSVGLWGGTTGITGTTPVTRYWVGNGGNWTDFANHWSASSGGAANASFPLGQDTVIIDAASFSAAAQTITLNTTAKFAVGSLNFTGIDNAPILDLNGLNLFVDGDLTINSGFTFTSNFGALWFNGRSTSTFTSNGATLSDVDLTVYFNMKGGTLSLGDAPIFPGTIQHYAGTFDANNKNLTVKSYNQGSQGSTESACTITMGSGTWTFNGDDDFGSVWSIGASGTVTVNANTSTMLINANTAVLKTFASNSGAVTYNKIEFDDTGTGGLYIEAEGVTINHLKLTVAPTNVFFGNLTDGGTGLPADPVYFGRIEHAGVAGSLTKMWNGESSDPTDTDSQIYGGQWSIGKPNNTGQIVLDFINLAASYGSGGGGFLAGSHSTDSSNNTNWNFVNSIKQVINS